MCPEYSVTYVPESTRYAPICTGLLRRAPPARIPRDGRRALRYWPPPPFDLEQPITRAGSGRPPRHRSGGLARGSLRRHRPPRLRLESLDRLDLPPVALDGPVSSRW